MKRVALALALLFVASSAHASLFHHKKKDPAKVEKVKKAKADKK